MNEVCSTKKPANASTEPIGQQWRKQAEYEECAKSAQKRGISNPGAERGNSTDQGNQSSRGTPSDPSYRRALTPLDEEAKIQGLQRRNSDRRLCRYPGTQKRGGKPEEKNEYYLIPGQIGVFDAGQNV
jgi:hypothetical protein